jgi:hypothetical protein
VDILRQLISRELCPHLERLSLDAYYRDQGERLRTIIDAIKEAENMKRGTLNELDMFFGLRINSMEPIILAYIKEVSCIPTKINVHNFHSIVRGRGHDFVTLERNWFGYYA